MKRCTVEKFMINRDRFRYESFSRKYNTQDLTDLFVSNYFQNPKKWVGEMDVTIMRKYQAIFENFSYKFREELEKNFPRTIKGIFDFVTERKAGCCMEVPAIAGVMHNKIPLFVLLALDLKLNFLTGLNERFDLDEFVWTPRYTRWMKLKPFIAERINKETVKEIVVEHCGLNMVKT